MEEERVAGGGAGGLGDTVTVDEPKSSLPSGVVTFVMTDIEGSTRLFREQREAYPALLDVHQRLLRAAFAAHGGVDVETEGDALLVAFADAAEALAGCLDGQLALAAHPWPPGADVRVRFGVNTGDATPTDGRYVSLALHQVARICASAHGGQILMSATTASAAEGRLPAGFGLSPLGSFQLRGFPNPERLYQLRHPGLRDDFPPLRALGVVDHNLPFFRSSFVGRTADRAALADLVRSSGVVSVVGVGGVGKTRLAVQVAFDVMEDFTDGAWLVELAPLSDPAAVPRAVASAVGVVEQTGRRVEDALLGTLASKTILILLDNCEHILDAVAEFAERLTLACPNLVVLATSREPLDIEGEAVWRVDPLPIARSDAVADAVRLFVDRASLARPGFELAEDNAAVVTEVVTRLNGIPLAIELAAATLGEGSLTGVLDGLKDRFALLSHGRRTAPRRHQTLRAALEWSLDLLSDQQRRLFARLAAFAGGGTIEAVTDVCADPPAGADDIPAMMRRLVRASLLIPHPEVAGRWSMLESIRELAALELIAAGESDRLAARHRDWYARRVEEIGSAVGLRGQGDVMVELAADHDNIGRAVDAAVAAGDVDRARRICVAMTPFWMTRGAWTEGSERLQAALALPGGEPGLRGRTLVARGSLLLLRGDLDDAARHFEEGGGLVEAAADDVALARALSGLGYVAFRQSRLGEAQADWEHALIRAEAAGDDRVAAGILRSLAIAAGSSGAQDRAAELLDRAVALAQQAGDDQLRRLLLGSSAEVHLWLGHYRVAADTYGDALDLASTIGDVSARPLLLAELGWVALLVGDIASAHRLSVDAAELAEELGNRRVAAHALRLTGEALLRRGDIAGAAEALQRALAVAESLGAPAEVAGVRCSQACLALDDQRPDEARALAEATVALSSLAHPMRRTTPVWVLGMAAFQLGDLEAAGRHFRQEAAQAANPTLPRPRANSLWGRAVVESACGRPAVAAELHARALETRHSIGDHLGVVDSLVAVSALCASIDPATAARLLAAANTMRADRGVMATKREADEVAAAMTAIAASDASLGAAAPAPSGAIDEAGVVEAAMGLLGRVTGERDAGETADPDTRSGEREE
ncbi:MAG TPA: adenylate/guanylate cyclase domain-containing protein [Acidimicrobiales bacterium]|nr:adenylate/guanylate cyclase domain-containing protein [Acidimicrobiales bacterium]